MNELVALRGRHQGCASEHVVVSGRKRSRVGHGERLRRALRIALGLAALAGFTIAAAPLVLYWYGLSRIPGERFEVGAPSVPDAAVMLLWASLGGTEQPALTPETPYGFVWDIYVSSTGSELERAGAPQQLANLAARAILPRGTRLRGGMAVWHLARASAVVWATRHWSPTQAASAWLNQASFGHGIVGLQAAAAAYFGQPPEQLNRTQHAMLIATIASRKLDVFGKTYPDPWCSLDEIVAEMQKLGLENRAAANAVRIQSAPAGACG